ncbi:ABC transporter substrate-binding protein [Nocardioidaceae bacterium SCSIO 66511]|nr:ABC transporter substrate-binding protein [Nocardioidaceae bacterium SCSIO 66511]
MAWSQRLEARAGSVDRRTFLRAAAAAGVLLGAGVSACGVESTSDGLGKRLVLRQLGEMSNLDPAFAVGQPDYELMVCVYEGLVGYPPGTMHSVSTIAEEMDVNEDGTRIRFRVRPGVRFHAGYGEVTAEDVKFSFERIAGVDGHHLSSPYALDWGTLEQVRVTGRYTGEIRLKAPFAPLFRTTLPLFSGFVLSKRATTERGDRYATSPIGTGPYEFVEWEPRQYALLRKFDGYSGSNSEYAHPVIWDEIEIRGILNDNSAAIGLTTGELDYGAIAPIDAPRLRGDDGFAVDRHLSFDYTFIGMNEKHEKLQDKRVREAVRAAIDVDSILAAAFDNAYDRATAIVPPTMGIGYWEDAPVRKPDPERARELMAEAGATDTTFNLTAATDQEASDVVLQVVQANLREAGIASEISMQEPGTFYTLGGRVQAAREIFYAGFNGLPDPFYSTVWFTCSQIDKWNYQSYCDKTFDHLNDRATRTLDEDERDRLYVEMQRRWDDACNTVWVTWQTTTYAGNTEVAPSIGKDGRMLPWNFRKQA